MRGVDHGDQLMS